MFDAIIAIATLVLVFGFSRLAAKKPGQRRAEPPAPRRPAQKPTPPSPRTPPVDILHEGDSRYIGGRYTGSLRGIAGEGDDPCHDGMGSPGAWGGEPATPQAALAPGIRLSFEANDVVKGVLYAEILGRKPPRRIR